MRWDVLRELYLPVVGPSLFEWGHLHELYVLLRDHFAEFTGPEQTATIEAIRNIPATGPDEEDVRTLRSVQRRWLSALVGKGAEAVDAGYGELDADVTLGRLPKHPEFDVYLESVWGPGPCSTNQKNYSSSPVMHQSWRSSTPLKRRMLGAVQAFEL